MHRIQLLVARRLSFFYGWVVLACAACAAFARQGPAVATLTIFMAPMTMEFGWSSSEMSGAVALGGILAAITTPMLGPLVDRHGARAMLCAAVLVTGVAALLLSQTSSLLMFYLFFCVARMNFAGPFDLGIYGAVNNWFVRRRPIANSMVSAALMIGLTSMPLIAHFAMLSGGWRAGWIAVGLTVLIVGFLPSFILMARRPEDMGLRPDGDAAPAEGASGGGWRSRSSPGPRRCAARPSGHCSPSRRWPIRFRLASACIRRRISWSAASIRPSPRRWSVCSPP